MSNQLSKFDEIYDATVAAREEDKEGLSAPEREQVDLLVGMQLDLIDTKRSIVKKAQQIQRDLDKLVNGLIADPARMVCSNSIPTRAMDVVKSMAVEVETLQIGLGRFTSLAARRSPITAKGTEG